MALFIHMLTSNQSGDLKMMGGSPRGLFARRAALVGLVLVLGGVVTLLVDSKGSTESPKLRADSNDSPLLSGILSRSDFDCCDSVVIAFACAVNS